MSRVTLGTFKIILAVKCKKTFDIKIKLLNSMIFFNQLLNTLYF